MIRDYQEQDSEAVLKVWLNASIDAHDFISAEFWQRQLANMRDIYLPAADVVIYQQEFTAQVVAFYALYSDTLAALFVAPEQQRQGIGQALLRHALQRHRQQSNKALRLSVYSANQRSREFYQQQGFRIQCEQIDNHTGQPEVVMVKEV